MKPLFATLLSPRRILVCCPLRYSKPSYLFSIASIITFLQRKPSDLVNYVALWASRQAPPTSLDEFTDLIYVFKEHGLVTVQGRYGSGTPSLSPPPSSFSSQKEADTHHSPFVM